jgi:hypothetical protein
MIFCGKEENDDQFLRFSIVDYEMQGVEFRAYPLTIYISHSAFFISKPVYEIAKRLSSALAVT